MGKRKIITISILVLLSVTTNVYAEPTPSVNYFMNESVSLFDFGIYKLNLTIESLCNYELKDMAVLYDNHKDIDVFYYSSEISYDWKKNRIRIIISPKYRNKKVDDKKLLDLCKRIISVVQNKFEIIDGKPLSNYSSLGTYFWHSGYKKTDEQIDFYKELDNITKIIVYTEDKIIESPLIGTEKDISFKTITK